MKKIITALMAITMLLSLVACSTKNETNSQETLDKESLTVSSEDCFEWDGDYICGLTSKGAKQTKLVIPSRCVGFYFTGLHPGFIESKVEEVYFESDKNIELGGAFCCVETLKKIVLPAELTTIGLMEFSACKSLEEITIPAGVEKIGDMAFERATALETVNFEGNTTTYIGYAAFENCKSLKNITLPDSITEISSSAFNGCENLKEITLPKNLSVLNEFVFLNTGITCVRVPAELEFTHVDLSAFGRVDGIIDVYVTEGSWADLNFDTVFSDGCAKKYTQ